MKNFSTLTLLILTLIGLLISDPSSAQQSGITWMNLKDGSFQLKGERRIVPKSYLVFRTDFQLVKSELLKSPVEFSDASRTNPFVISLPLPNGNFQRFIITEYSMMEPGLASQFPEMKTYNAKGIDDPFAVGKLDVTIHGFHGMILSPNGDFFIDPISTNEMEIYISYYKSAAVMIHEFKCETPQEVNSDGGIFNHTESTGQQLRTYRLACAATGEYTAYHGGTAALGQAAIVTAINRVNQVYERDASVRMTLVANNINVVYTNSGSDPYSNNNGGAMLSQNQTTLDNVIGSSNYDIGHVFSTGGGGVAYLGVVCVAGYKAGGVTGLPTPIGDPFYIDFVAHEMGHQFGGNHTFNSVTSNCGGGNRNASTAWEPGSGSTIMAYAGICGADDLQSNSDDYFHTGSVSEITAYTQTGSGNSCPAITNTGNTPPSVTVPTGGFTIPISTPFQLTGSATDVENPGSLTYCWEEFDLGPAGSPGSPSGNAPIFRSFSPVTSPTRIFPKLGDLLSNSSTIGEILPSYTRSLNFRLTVRDNNSGGGGINFGTVAFNVTSTAGPFLVTQPNTNVSWVSSNPQTVTWNVANTTASPVSCPQVNIKLSTDGGLTFPTTLLANTTNDGSENVNLPNIVTTQARIKVEASNNIFFDISNTDFSINSGSGPSLLCEAFTSVTFPPSGWNIEYSGTNYWTRNTVSAYGVGSGSAKFDFWNATTGTIQSLVTLDFAPSLAGDSLKFDHAYGPYSSGVDSLIIQTSTNNGTTYSTLVSLYGGPSGGPLNTAGITGSPFVPTSGQWAAKKYPLPVGTNKVKFRARSGFGNNLYVDNPCVGNGAAPVASTFTLAPQGFYNTSTSKLNMKDTVTVYLRNTVSPYTIVDSGKTVIDSVTLSGSVTFANASSGTYYIMVRHRNALETWSDAGGESYVKGTSLVYDFTTSAVKAYGGNQIQVGPEFCLYSGDVNFDYSIDLSDLILIFNDASAFASGYIVSDLTGDGFADVSDLIIAFNNSSNFVSRQAPPGAEPQLAGANENVNNRADADVKKIENQDKVELSKE